MSLRKLMQPKPKEKPPLVEAEVIPPGEPSGGSLIGAPAVLPEQKLEGIAGLLEILKSRGAGFSMNEILSMDSQNQGVFDALVLPVGGKENDKYKMLERTRLSQYEIELFTDAIDMAEHGIGLHLEGIPAIEDLDFVEPRMGEWVVSKLRGYVSKDGASLEVFENVAQPWIRGLWEKQNQQEAQSSRGIQQ